MSLKITVIHHNSWHIGLALNEQARRVTDWRIKRRWKVVELKNHPQHETDGKLQFHACLMLMAQVLVLGWIQFYLLKKMTQQCLDSSLFFLFTDEMVALDCILNSCFNICVSFYIQVLCLKI